MFMAVCNLLSAGVATCPTLFKMFCAHHFCEEWMGKTIIASSTARWATGKFTDLSNSTLAKTNCNASLCGAIDSSELLRDSRLALDLLELCSLKAFTLL